MGVFFYTINAVLRTLFGVPLSRTNWGVFSFFSAEVTRPLRFLSPQRFWRTFPLKHSRTQAKLLIPRRDSPLFSRSQDYSLGTAIQPPPTAPRVLCSRAVSGHPGTLWEPWTPFLLFFDRSYVNMFLASPAIAVRSRPVAGRIQSK